MGVKLCAENIKPEVEELEVFSVRLCLESELDRGAGKPQCPLSATHHSSQGVNFSINLGPVPVPSKSSDSRFKDKQSVLVNM